MLRIYLMTTGSLRAQPILMATTLAIIGLDAVVREFLLFGARGTTTIVLSIVLYVLVTAAFVMLSKAPNLEAFPKSNVDHVVLIYIGLYCSALVSAALFIPGSTFMDSVCDSQESSCSLKRISVEFALRLLGITAVLDFVDVKRLREYRAK